MEIQDLVPCSGCERLRGIGIVLDLGRAPPGPYSRAELQNKKKLRCGAPLSGMFHLICHFEPAN